MSEESCTALIISEILKLAEFSDGNDPFHGRIAR
jgi:hypothetical protein